MIKKSAICILGGMGPEASEYLYRLLIEMSTKYFGAKNNEDFPEIVLASVPVPDFISSDTKRQEVLQMLNERVVKLNNLDISCFSIACNTAHILLPQLQSLTKVPFISMIDEVVKLVKEEGRKKVGLLGTPSTIRYELYQSALQKEGIETIVPTKKQLITLEKIIRNILKGRILLADSKKLVVIARGLEKQGAEGIILGCTELPLVFPLKYDIPIYNSVEVLALALLRNYYK